MATIQEVVIKIDAGNGIKTIKDLQEQISSYKNELSGLKENTNEYNASLKALLDTTQKLMEGNKEADASSSALTDAFQNVTDVLTGLNEGISSFQRIAELAGIDTGIFENTIVKLKAAMEMTETLKAVSSGIKSANVAFKAFNATLLANPLTWIAALVVGLIIIFDDMKEELVFLIRPIKELWNQFTTLLGPIKNTENGFETLKAAVVGVVTALVRFHTGPLKAVIKLFKGDFKGALNELKNGFNVVTSFTDGYSRSVENSAKKTAQAAEETVEATKKITKSKKEEKDRTDELIQAEKTLAGQREKYAADSAKALTKGQDRIDYLQKEIEANKNLQDSYNQIINNPKAGIDARIEATNNLIAAEREMIELNAEVAATEAKLSEDRIKFENALKEAQGFNPDASLEEIEAAKQLAHEQEIERLYEISQNEKATFAERAEALTQYNKFVDQKRTENRKQEEIEAKKEEENQEKLKDLKLKLTTETLAEGARLLAENTVISKGLQVASATMSTYTGATQVLANPTELSPFMKWAQFAATIATGLSAVKNILAVNVPGGSGSGSAAVDTSGISLPSMPDFIEPVSETYTNITGADESFINSLPQAVLVVEDLSSVQNRVNIAETNSNF